VTQGARSGGNVLGLSGGIGGAKLMQGLDRVLDRGVLRVVANVGDDFTHLGLAICPDVDTLLYTLAGLADPVRGWGRRDETWTFMAALATLGAPTWFQLGDGDLALHVERTRRIADGESLSAITDAFRRQLAIASVVLPATDDVVRTRVRTPDGWLSFQEYFVARRCEPLVEALAYDGAATARPCAAVLEALADPSLRAVIIGPSNPLLSIEPMLAMPGLRDALRRCGVPIIAVSPIIAGAAVKGPTAKMLRELGRPVDALEAARRYADFIDGYVVDDSDQELVAAAPPGIHVIATNTLMPAMEAREQLARECLAFADALAGQVQVQVS